MAVDPAVVLEAVLDVPISEWSYSDDPETRHVGPMAQDFHAAFGLGASETGIATLDTSGVALASIQALAAENQALGGANLALNSEVGALQVWVGLLTLLMTGLGLTTGVGHLRRRRRGV